MNTHPSHAPSESAYVGCLLGGAIGDALGWPVEFASLGKIRSDHGPDGVRDLRANGDGLFEVTDDTQMTLFTAEGLIRAQLRGRTRGIGHTETVVRRAYLRWLRTQREPWPGVDRFDERPDGWLIREPRLWAARAPGNTCLAALVADGDGVEAKNSSKGCGAVMKTAPVGLLMQNPFDLGASVAKITHGHPTAALSAGALSQIIADLAWGRTLPEAIDHALEMLAGLRGHEETSEAIRSAVGLAAGRASISPEDIESLGGGWVAEEALGIALACSLRAQSFTEGVRMAVNHSGDSDSTGAIAGNLLGLLLGVESIPENWLESLELRSTIETVARDLLVAAKGELPNLAGLKMNRRLINRADREAVEAFKDCEARELELFARWAARYPPN